MATGHFYLTSSSAGAPQLNNTAGSLIAILDWALDIAGGTRGWSKPFIDGTNIAVYRPDTGIRPYLRVSDNGTETAYARMFRTMTDINTGTGACPNGSNQSASYCRPRKANEGGTHTYYIVGDSRYFALVSNGANIYSYRNMTCFAFGEFNSYDPLDSNNVVLVASADASNNTAYNIHTKNFLQTNNTGNLDISSSYAGTADNPGSYCLASPDGLLESTGAIIHDPFGCYASNGRTGAAHYGSSPALVYQPFYIYDTNGASGLAPDLNYATNGSTGYIRGVLPYIYSTPYAGATGAIHGGQVLDGASEFRTIDVSQSLNSTGAVKEKIYVIMLRESNDEPGRV